MMALPPIPDGFEIETDPTSKTLHGVSLKGYAEDPNHFSGVSDLYHQTKHIATPEEADTHIRSAYPNSPITGQMIFDSAQRHGVSPNLLLPLLQWESHFGTAGLATKTRNPGNIGGDTPDKRWYFDDWGRGVDETAKWLGRHKVSGGKSRQSTIGNALTRVLSPASAEAAEIEFSELPPLPDGFVLEADVEKKREGGQAQALPPLPPGFVLESESEVQPTRADTSMIQPGLPEAEWVQAGMSSEPARSPFIKKPMPLIEPDPLAGEPQGVDQLDYLGISDEARQIRPILAKHADKNFVQRIISPEKYPTLPLGKGFSGTHLMSADTIDDQAMVYPLIVQDSRTKKMTKLSRKDAIDYALKTGEFIPFDSDEEAIWFSKNYKSVWGKPQEASQFVSDASVVPSPEFQPQQGAGGFKKYADYLAWQDKQGIDSPSTPLGRSARKAPSTFGEFLTGTASAFLRMAPQVGRTEAFGAMPEEEIQGRLEGIKETSRGLSDVAQKFRDNVEAINREKPSYLQGRLWDKPELAAEPDWWLEGIGDTITSLAPTIGAGVVGGPAVAGVAGGSMEGESFFLDLINDKQNPVAPEVAAVAATTYGVASGILNAYGFGSMFGEKELKKGVLGALQKVYRGAKGEGGTEYLENPIQSIIESLARGESRDATTARFLDSLKDVEPGIFGAVTGGAMAGASRGQALSPEPAVTPPGGQVAIKPPVLDAISDIEKDLGIQDENIIPAPPPQPGEAKEATPRYSQSPLKTFDDIAVERDYLAALARVDTSQEAQDYIAKRTNDLRGAAGNIAGEGLTALRQQGAENQKATADQEVEDQYQAARERTMKPPTVEMPPAPLEQQVEQLQPEQIFGKGENQPTVRRPGEPPYVAVQEPEVPPDVSVKRNGYEQTLPSVGENEQTMLREALQEAESFEGPQLKAVAGGRQTEYSRLQSGAPSWYRGEDYTREHVVGSLGAVLNGKIPTEKQAETVKQILEAKRQEWRELYGEDFEAGVNENATVPEAPETIDQQIESLKAGTVPVVMFPPSMNEKTIPAVPKGMKRVTVSNAPGAGTYFYDPSKIRVRAIQDAAAAGTHGELLGHVQTKPEAAAGGNPVVVQAVRDGTVVQDSAVDGNDAAAVERQSEVLRDRHPGATVEIRRPEEVIGERSNNAPSGVKQNNWYKNERDLNDFLSRELGVENAINDYPAGIPDPSMVPNDWKSLPIIRAALQYKRLLKKEQPNAPTKPTQVPPNTKRSKTDPVSRLQGERESLTETLGQAAVDSIVALPRARTQAHSDLERVAKLFGLEIVWWKSDNAAIAKVDGFVSNDRKTLFIRANATQPLLYVVGHETIHSIQARAPKLYDQLLNALREGSYSEGYIASILQSYDEAGIERPSEERLFDEFVGHVGGHEFQNPLFWEQFNERNPSLAQKIARIVDRILDRILKAFGAHRTVNPYVKDVKKFRKVLADVLGDFARSEGVGVDVAGGDVPFALAYHGGPYEFSRFSLEHVGRGEGAQAFGWGIYLAGNKEVAEYYRKNVKDAAAAPLRFYKGKQLQKGSPEYHAATLVETTRKTLLGVRTEVKGWIENAKQGEDVDHYRKVLDFLNNATSKKEFTNKPDPGHLYKVDIPEESDLLQWDKPLSEQPRKVKEIIKKTGVRKKFRENKSNFSSHQSTRVDKGSGLYEFLSEQEGSPKAASEYLRSIGIPGHSYPEGTIAGGGKGGRNYVIYDEAAVQILERNKDKIASLLSGNPRQTQFSFAGPKAQGWDKAEGKFSSLYDKKARFEIDDSKAKLKDARDTIVSKISNSNSGNVRLSYILDHQQLYTNYPDAENIKVTLASPRTRKASTGASYNPATDTITINPDMPYREHLPSILHELAHAIQEREGFAKGGSASGPYKEGERSAFIDKLANDIMDLHSRSQTGPYPVEPISRKEAIGRATKYADSPEGRDQHYRMLAGEIEARDVSARANLTPEQRRATPPYSSENIAPEDAIVRFGEGGTQFAIAPKDLPESAKAKLAGTKVVGEGGEPLVVYHGTSDIFDDFSNEFATNAHTQMLGVPTHFFSSNPDVSASYLKHGEGSPNVRPVYLKIENPLVIDGSGKTWDEVISDVNGRLQRYMSKEEHDFAKYRDSLIDKYGEDDWEYEDINKLMTGSEAKKLYSLQIEANKRLFETNNAINRGGKMVPHALSHDGIIIRGVWDMGGKIPEEYLPDGGYAPYSDIYAVFSPDQIVSALSPEGKAARSESSRKVISLTLSSGRKTKVVRNPENADYQAFGDMFREKYPDAPRGEPKTRKTLDENGNVYLWSSDYTHSEIEGAIRADLGIKTSQNMEIKPAPETIQRADGTMVKQKDVDQAQADQLRKDLEARKRTQFSVALSDYQKKHMSFEPGTESDWSKTGIRLALDKAYAKLFMAEYGAKRLGQVFGGKNAADHIENLIRRIRARTSIAQTALVDGPIKLDAQGNVSRTGPGLSEILSPLKTRQEMVDYDTFRNVLRVAALNRFRGKKLSDMQAEAAKMKAEIKKMRKEPGWGDIKSRQYVKAYRATVKEVKDIQYLLKTLPIQEAQVELGRIGATYPPAKIKEWRDISDKHRKFEENAILRPLLEIGKLSQARFDEITQSPESEFYASFMREMADTEAAAWGKTKAEPLSAVVSGGKTPGAIKRLKGSKRKMLPSIEGTIANVANVTKLVETQRLYQEIVKLRDIDPDAKEVIKQVKMRPDGAPPRNSIQIYKDGKTYHYQLPQWIAQGIDYYQPNEISFVWKMFSLPATGLRYGATMAVDFVVRNPIRDQFSAMVYSKHGYVPFLDLARGIVHYFGDSSLYKEFKAAGGEQNYFSMMDREATQLKASEIVGYRKQGMEKAIRYASSPFRLWKMLSESLEVGTRIGEYRKARAKGMSSIEAQAAARDLAIDFQRKGGDQIVRAMNMITAFWNANIQGTDKMVREFANKETRLPTLGRAFAGITLPSIILWGLFHDNDEWKELPDWRKNFFWNIPLSSFLGKGAPILSLPKPFELGLIFGSLPERILDWAFANRPDTIKSMGAAIVDGAFPGMIPTAALPFIEAWANYSFFMDAPLESRGEQQLPPGMRANQYTSEVIKSMGYATNVSPKKLENWARAWTGNLGKMGLDLTDKILFPTDIPPVSKKWYEYPGFRAFFAKEPVGSAGKALDRFYDNLDKCTQAKNGYKALSTQDDRQEANKYREINGARIAMANTAEDVASQLSTNRKRKVAVMRDKSKSPDEKRKEIDRIDRRMSEAAERFNVRMEKRLKEGLSE